MARLRCVTCGGVYHDVLSDGTRYFHACPPLHLARVKHLDGTIEDVPLDRVAPTDERLGEIAAPRPRARDENVTVDAAGRVQRKADGAGVVELPPLPPEDV